jgi:acyl dehydratase
MTVQPAGLGIDTLQTGDVVVEREYAITRDTLVRYAGASGDFNPIHYRDDVAASVGLPGVLAHGMLTMGLAVQPVVDVLGDPGRVTDYQVRFTRPVVVDPQAGAIVTVTAKVVRAENGIVSVVIRGGRAPAPCRARSCRRRRR